MVLSSSADPYMRRTASMIWFPPVERPGRRTGVGEPGFRILTHNDRATEIFRMNSSSRRGIIDTEEENVKWRGLGNLQPEKAVNKAI